MANRVLRLFWEVFDAVAYAVTSARSRLVDRICGPEPPTPADHQREIEKERLQRAFSAIVWEPRRESDVKDIQQYLPPALAQKSRLAGPLDQAYSVRGSLLWFQRRAHARRGKGGWASYPVCSRPNG